MYNPWFWAWLYDPYWWWGAWNPWLWAWAYYPAYWYYYPHWYWYYPWYGYGYPSGSEWKLWALPILEGLTLGVAWSLPWLIWLL